ncbi:MAG: ATP phosphoribosyltransferase [Candidatus Nezhaarchaeales archaeon]
MPTLKVALPKGHLWNGVKTLLEKAGYDPRVVSERSYLVHSNDPELEVRIHRAQNIAPLVEEGSYDLGITGLDWILETSANVEDLMDLGVGSVKIVAAFPQYYGIKADGEAFKKLVEKARIEGKDRIIAASEYENLTRKLCEEELNGYPYRVLRSYGATETFIGVADLIVDCVETGETLKENGWEIVHVLFESTARVIANKRSLTDPWKRDKIEGFVTLLRSVKEAEGMKLLKMNVPPHALSEVVGILPAMKSPTISKLYGENAGYAVEVAVKSSEVIRLIPALKKKGATDILELDLKKVIR